ncbi:hypothetical protein GJ496_009804 [Pomphorhynchus laevis]|nr:hypothetical protein GJ496_009804 [Pomphorhynchus laevis]
MMVFDDRFTFSSYVHIKSSNDEMLEMFDVASKVLATFLHTILANVIYEDFACVYYGKETMLIAYNMICRRKNNKYRYITELRVILNERCCYSKSENRMNRPGCRDNVDIFNLTNFDEDTSSDDDTIVSSSEFIDDSDFSDDEDHPYMFDMCDIGYDTDYDSYCSDEDLQ